VDLRKPAVYRDAINNVIENYPERYDPGTHDIDRNLIDDMQSWYARSVNYTAEQIAHLVRFLKKEEIFEKSLLLITGDHGEEFGEQRFFGHESVNDRNIRPFMTIKPPADTEWNIRDNVDLIDFLPTIAELVGVENMSSDGIPLQDGEIKRPRITERIRPDWYTLSVEIEDCKGIFIYRTEYPNRPTEAVRNHNPEKELYRRLPSVRSSSTNADVDSQRKERMRSICEEFVENTESEYTADDTVSRPSQETLSQLEDLGYK
jgi:arylsulfatase A-like enzyme